MRSTIQDAFAQWAVPLPGTDCTSWSGPLTGNDGPQVWVKDNMARTVGQCVWYLEHDEDLNQSGYYLRNLCGNVGCTNPNHYKKCEYKKEKVKNTKPSPNKKPTTKTPEIIPRYLLRPNKFNEILTRGNELNAKYYAKLYNVPLTLVRKIINRTAVMDTSSK